MVQIDYSKKFLKKLEKSSPKVRKAFKSRLNLFIENPSHPQLRNHALTGKFKGYRSFNVTGDWRAIFIEKNNGKMIIFMVMGTHSQLY